MAILLLSATPSVAHADALETLGRVGDATFDIVVLRPLGAAATVGGFGVFLITAPLLAPSGEVMFGWDTFVMNPYEATILRPLGDF